MLLALGALFGAWIGGRHNASQPPAGAARARPLGSTPPGLWHPARDPRPRDREATGTAEGLAALPYLQGYEAAPTQKGVTVHDPERAQQGLNLVTSGHGPEAFLMDMDGRPLHTWRLAAERVWPDVDSAVEGSKYWRRVHAFENGDLLAIFDGLGLIKLDRRSQMIWSYRAVCHHDLFVAPNGTIYVLTRELRSIPEVHPTRASLEEFVTVLGPDGRPRRSFSLYAAFKNSAYAPLLARVSHGGDIFHTNTLTILDGSLADRWPLFAPGRALISLRNLDTVAVVDLEAGRVVWALNGLWRAQHEPSLLPSGRLLVFDNAGRAGHSRAIELDPFTQQVAWTYPSRSTDADLSSGTSGTTQRLSSGNTLITESTGGRALEVTAEGRTVWEFWNPHRAGKQNELIATLLEVVRLDGGFGLEAGLGRDAGDTR